MKSNLSIIIRREYLERVNRKSFIISTILTPVLMLALMLVPTLIAIYAGPEDKKIAVFDASTVVAPRLQSDEGLKFVPIDGAELDSIKSDEAYDAVLVIGSDVVSRPEQSVTLFTRGAASMATESYIRGEIKNAVRDRRIRAYNIDNLAQILEEVEPDVVIDTKRIDSDEEKSTSSALSYAIAMLTMLVLYMFILMYGQMVMTSIIEEKNNRVLELVVSSVKPFHLMTGKILGIGLVAVTQILIWTVLLLACSMWLMPPLIKAAASADAQIASTMSMLADPMFMGNLLVFLVLFLIGGYMFYSSIFAAIGSSVDNIQDASQLTTLAVVPIIVALVISMAVANDPNSSLALWCSYIPFTSPMVMMARMPFGIPLWQEILSLAVLVVSFIFMIWLCGKIYRVGIFMYGKKPSMMEIIKWVRYK